MKKIVIYVSCLLLVVSCSNYEEPLKNVIVEDQGNDIPTLRMARDGDKDVLGFGYDVSGAYLGSESVKEPVIDIYRFANDYPYYILYDGSGDQISSYTYGYNAEDYLFEMTNAVSANVKADFSPLGIKLFSGTFSNDNNFESVVSHSAQYMFASCDITQLLKRIYLSGMVDVNLLKGYLSPSFIQALNTKSADEIIQLFGTHVLTDFTIGGRCSFIFRSMANTSMTNVTKKDVVKAGANFSFLKIGINADASINQQTINNYKDNNQSKTLYVEYHGGIGTGITYNLETGYPTINPGAWAQTLNINNAVLTKIDWNKVIPIWEFALNPNQREALRVAAINHVKNNMIHSYELLPMIVYQYQNGTAFIFYGGDKNSPYFSPLSTNNNYYSTSTIAGYILRNQEEGTLPLYLFQNMVPYPQTQRFLYTTNRNIQTNYKYIGFLGYVYTEQKQGTLPGTTKTSAYQSYPLYFDGDPFYMYVPN